ncbi:HEAT repeat-containing protein 6 [Hondaea fermentalgiana]|uniref:HEAT repeat-containing protein 6 n=1 Tax=Hondaea fermentalgiana TaxID=2315210 RepID=A0A2R5GKL0_9STRA|nr:HEAT repeat-containing protein 6 [Hondaea fermentalgiana]|eukprot:GBG31417.1 HEAT repeat-containing protein 6 [Hondaea fermentalgiana]
MGTPSQSGPPLTTRKFSFSSSLRAGSGNAALQRERAKWNVWVCKTEKRLRQGEASASESEMSDSDLERKSSSSRVLKQLEKIRLAALDLLDALCKFDRKLMQTQWERLLPQRNGSVLNLKAPHLLTVLLFDAQPRVRCATFRVVSALFANSPVRVWLSQPRPAGKASAFVPMSVKISRIVEEVFYALGRVLGGQESNPTALEQAHQCAVTVLRAVPFEVRGNEGFFLTPFLQGCAGPLTARLADAKVPEKVRLAAAATCAALVSAPKARLESVAAFTTTHLIPALEQVDLAANEWSMPLVGAMCEQYAREVSRGTLWDATHRVLLQCFASRLPSSRRAAVGLVERILRRDKVSEPPITSALAGWNEVLSVHLPRALRDPDPDVRSCAAVCVSEIRTEGWALVSDAQRRECVGGILSAYGGKEETQRATLTALGAMALVPEFRTPVFMRDGVPLLLVALEASNLQVRARGALALANFVYEPDRASHLDQLIAPDTRCALTEACITHVPDHDKVAAPCLRALGALYAGFATSLSDNEDGNGSQQGNLGARVAHALLEGANGKGEASAKVRWSACASIGLVLSRGTDSTRQRDFVEVLADQAAQNDNFKVRIAAVTALHEGIRALHARSDLRAVVRETLGPALLSLVNARGMVDVSQARFAAKLDDALRALLRGVADSEWPEQGGDLASLIGSQEMLRKE